MWIKNDFLKNLEKINKKSLFSLFYNIAFSDTILQTSRTAKSQFEANGVCYMTQIFHKFGLT